MPSALGSVVPARLSATELPGIDDRTPPWPGVRAVAGEAQLHVRRTPSTAGDPEPALYIHGLAGSSTNWTDLAGALAPWLAGEAVDLPGFGQSGPAPRNDYSIGAFADVLIAYLDGANRGPVHLFGNSMGGAVALQIAARRPDLIRTLTVISPAVPDLRLRRPGTDSAMALFLLPGLRAVAERRLAAISPQVRARGLIDVCFADPARVPPHRLEEAAEDIRARQHLPWTFDAFTRSLRGLARSYLTVGPHSAWRSMARISVPTVVIWGTEDKLVDVGLAPRVARTVPGARLLVLPEVGHVAQLEDPESVARAFLALREDAGRTVIGLASTPAPTGGASVRVPAAGSDRVGA